MLKKLPQTLIKHRILAAASGALVAMGASSPVLANSFQGTIWSLTYSGAALPDADPLHETFRVTLGIDTNGYSGTGSFLDQVAVKVSDSFVSASLYSAPFGVASWALVPGGISASGCNGAGSGFECVNSLAVLNAGKGVAINPGNGVGIDYSWVLDITMDNGALFTGLDMASVKGRFVNSSGAKVGDLVSEHITLTTPVPEPETYAMLLAGLGLLGFAARRRKQKELAAA